MRPGSQTSERVNTHSCFYTQDIAGKRTFGTRTIARTVASCTFFYSIILTFYSKLPALSSARVYIIIRTVHPRESAKR